MPDPLERRCALFILIPNQSRGCPDGTALSLALGDRLGQLHVVAWTDGPEPDRTCLRRAAEAADTLKVSTGAWPRYMELCDATAVLEPDPDPAVDIVVALASNERRHTHRAARALAVRSNAHFAVLTTTGHGAELGAGRA